MHVAITAVGVDRPGIVAAVTRVLYEQGANIEDSRMAILGGHFAMVLIVALGGTGAKDLEAALSGPAADLDLVVSVRPVADAAPGDGEGVPYVVSVYGADRPGIVASVSESLATHRVNISDLATHVVGDDPPVYVMLLEVTVPPTVDASTVSESLRAIATDLGVDVSMQPMEPETL